MGETKDEYAFKYSGGMATYPQQHAPIACYAAAANKTFFVYGGTPRGKGSYCTWFRTLTMQRARYRDRGSSWINRPPTPDDNPTLALDPQGYLWIFSNSHMARRDLRSFIDPRKPHSIDAFRRVVTANFSYSQPWSLGQAGFLVLHTRDHSGRGLFWMTSPDGFDWSEPQSLARRRPGALPGQLGSGQRRVATAFNYHPARGGLDARTNLYFLQTFDGGRTWQTAAGKAVTPPITEVRNPALVRDYESEGLLVYLKEVRFDSQGRPLISVCYQPRT